MLMGEESDLGPPFLEEALDVASPEEMKENDAVMQRYNCQLPLSYRSNLDKERKLLIRALHVLASAILSSTEALSQPSVLLGDGAAKDEAATCEAPIAGEGYEFELERDYAALEKGINRYLDLKHAFHPEDYPFFVKVILRGALSQSVDMGLRSKLARAIGRLLQKRQCVIPDGVPWRPIMNTILKYHINCVTGGPFIGRDIRDAHCRNMVTLLACSRNYLAPGDSAQKIWEEFAPKLAPSVDIDLRFQELLLLVHFLPTRGASWSAWMPQGMEIWESVESSSDWDASWMILMNRLARHQPCAHDWTPYLPLVYGRLTSSLHLPLGAIAPQGAIDRRCPQLCGFLLDGKIIHSAASLLVSTLTPKHPETFVYLERLFAVIANYFHPSNSGRWSGAIGTFLVHVTANLVFRVIEERNATKAGISERVESSADMRGCPPTEHRLTEEDTERLVALLRPLIQHGLHSKVNSMSVQAASAARDLAVISPQSVIEPFIIDALDGLESISSPHRTVAALRMLSTLSSVFLDSHFFPNGADYLPQVMMLTLPGIDPNDLSKTESTLKFIAATAGRIQSTVASDSQGTVALFLEEYIHQFLERAFSLLESLEAPPKKGRNGTIPAGGSQLSFFIFSVCIENLFAALPEGLVLSAAQRISRQVNGAACPNAMKFYAVMVRTAAAAAASTSQGSSAGMFLPSLLDQIVGPSTLSESTPAFVSVAEEELVWRIRMLAQACRCCGDGVLHYVDRISCVVHLAFEKPSRPVYKAGGRLLRGLLEGLCATHIKFGAGKETKSDSVRDGETYDFDWKEPSASEWEAAERIIETFIDAAEKLSHEERLVSISDETTSDRDVLFRVLRLLHAIQRGGRWVFCGAFPDYYTALEKHVNPESQMSKADAKVILRRPVTAGLGGEREGSSGAETATQLWYRVFSLVSKIARTVATVRPDDGALLYRCLEPMELAHEPFRRGNKSRQPLHTSRAYKAVYKPIIASKRDFLSDGGAGRSMPRFVVKLRVEAHHEMRLSLAARGGLCSTELFEKLVSQLTDLSVNDFPRVRAEARGVLTRAMRVARPRVRSREICRVIEVLEKSAAGVSATSLSGHEGREADDRVNGVSNGVSKPAAGAACPPRHSFEENGASREGSILYDRMIGAAAVLRSTAAAPIIMRDWTLFSQVVKALLDAMLAAERPDAAGAVGNLFAKLSALVRPLGIEPIRLVEEDFTTVRRDALSQLEEEEKVRKERLYQDLNSFLLGMLDRTSESLKHEQGEKKEAHWRLQSLVATVLHIILREDRPPSPAVAEFFINGMVSDVVTLRQVSCKAMMVILAVHGRRAGVGHCQETSDDSPSSWSEAGNEALSTIGSKVCSPSFARKLVHTLALDHDDDGGSRSNAVGNAGGAIAVMNLSRLFDGDSCWMLAGGRPWPSSWVPRSRDSLNIVRLRLYESFVRVFGRHVLAALLPTVTEMIQKAEAKEERIISGVKDEDVRVLAGEVLAGICRGLDVVHCNAGTYENLEDLSITLLSDMTGRLGNVTGGTIIRLIATADEFTVGRRVWKGVLNWLLRKKPVIVKMGSGPVAHLQSRRLRYLHSCVADLDASRNETLSHFVKETLDSLTDQVAFDHELKTVREEVARCLALIAVLIPAELQTDFDGRIEALRSRLSKDDTDSDETALTADAEEQMKKSRSRQGETLSRFVSILYWGGRSDPFQKYLSKVLPALFESFDESDPERISHARMSLSFTAQARFSPSTIEHILLAVEETVEDLRWKVRASVLAFLQVFSFVSLFTASSESLRRIRNIVLKLMSDTQLEVRQASAAAFVTMIRDSTPEAIHDVREDCMKVLKDTTPTRRGSKRPPLTSDSVRRRHGAVLGLSSMIVSSPYSVPKWMPSVLVALSGAVNDPPPISTGVRKLFADFMRTHRDEWQAHKLAFTPDELEIVSELLVSPSYYA